MKMTETQLQLTGLRILVLSGYVALTIILTFPLIVHLSDAVAGHDTLYTAWLLAWGAHQFRESPAHIFDTNIYYPDKNTLAYGEHLLGFLPFTIPLFLFIQNSLLVHNVLLLFMMAATAWTAYFLSENLPVQHWQAGSPV